MKLHVFAVLLSIVVTMFFIPNAAPFPAQHKPKMVAVHHPRKRR